eukprot:5512926-Alexandrium_andersonii.AAC.1
MPTRLEHQRFGASGTYAHLMRRGQGHEERHTGAACSPPKMSKLRASRLLRLRDRGGLATT